MTYALGARVQATGRVIHRTPGGAYLIEARPEDVRSIAATPPESPVDMPLESVMSIEPHARESDKPTVRIARPGNP